jgi:peptidoglycan/LPS O-acetylase OafA/YrhL
MFFYACFALVLPLRRRRAVAWLSLGLGAAVLAGGLLRPQTAALAVWTDPVLLQFVLGMGLALLRARGLALAGWARLALALTGLLLLAALPVEWPRGLRFGPGAGLLVAAAALGPEPRLPPGLAGWMARLGDASYALYLTHPFALRAVALAWAALALHGAPVALLASAAAVLLALALALAVHRWFEAPLTRALTARLLRRSAATKAGPEPEPLPLEQPQG